MPAILYCYSNMGRHYIHEYLTPSYLTKTEIIIFNVNGIECNLTFNFDQTTIDPVHTHKHLGIVFSSDCKWTKHIDKFIESASKQLIFMYSEN